MPTLEMGWSGEFFFYPLRLLSPHLIIHSPCLALTRLQTTEQYENLARQWPINVRDRCIERNPESTEAEQQKFLDRGKREKKKLLEYITRPVAALNAADKKRIVHFHRYQLFTPAYHSNVYGALRDMGTKALGAAEAVAADAQGKVNGNLPFAVMTPADLSENLPWSSSPSTTSSASRNAFLIFSVTKEWKIWRARDSDAVRRLVCIGSSSVLVLDLW